MIGHIIYTLPEKCLFILKEFISMSFIDFFLKSAIHFFQKFGGKPAFYSIAGMNNS